VGNTRRRSWSFSRQRLFQTCRRAYFYQYYWKEEPNQDVLWELRRVKSVPMVVGDVAESISVALRQWVYSHVEARNLFDVASKQYENVLKASLRAATVMREGRRPPSGKWPIFNHHLKTGERSAVEDMGRETLRDYLADFEASEAWQFLWHKKTHHQLWEPITTSSDDKQSFMATTVLRFERAAGIRIYTPSDLALTHRGEFIIVDWKAGHKNEEAVAQVRKQFASYCLWALDYKKATRSNLRVQPYFLQTGETWARSSVNAGGFLDVIHQIEDHVLNEMQHVAARGDENGESIAYVAREKDFPPSPRQSVCAACKSLTVCNEEKKAVKGSRP